MAWGHPVGPGRRFCLKAGPSLAPQLKVPLCRDSHKHTLRLTHMFTVSLSGESAGIHLLELQLLFQDIEHLLHVGHVTRLEFGPEGDIWSGWRLTNRKSPSISPMLSVFDL